MTKNFEVDNYLVPDGHDLDPFIVSDDLKDYACLNLIEAILRCARKDLSSRIKRTKEAALNFFYGKDFEIYCSYLDEDPSLYRIRIGLHDKKETASSLVRDKAPKDMTPEELKLYRSAYRRQYNAQKRAKKL